MLSLKSMTINVASERVEKREAIRRLRLAGREQEAQALEGYSSENDTDMGWDGWIRGAHPDVVDVIWP
jgi:hypothetical protein